MSRGLIVALAVAVTVPATARADDARPWAVGVADEAQSAALAFFRAGNEEFAQGRLVEAIQRYREAL